MCSILGMKWWRQDSAAKKGTKDTKPDVTAAAVAQRADKVAPPGPASKVEQKELAAAEMMEGPRYAAGLFNRRSWRTLCGET
jgi:hypothetical protein